MYIADGFLQVHSVCVTCNKSRWMDSQQLSVAAASNLCNQVSVTMWVDLAQL